MNRRRNIFLGILGGIIVLVVICVGGYAVINWFVESLDSRYNNTPIVQTETTCNEVTIIASNLSWQLRNNQDIGDQANWSVVTASNQSGNKFTAVIEPGSNLDFESDFIYGSDWILRTSSRNDVLCFAKNQGEGTLLYVGTSSAPTGWSKDFPSGWDNFNTDWSFPDDEEIATGGNWGPGLSIEPKAGNHVLSDNDWLSCQLWNHNQPGVVWHTAVQAQFELTIPGSLQGTCWTHSGGDTTLFFARVVQASNWAAQRDEVADANLHRYFCGDDDQYPDVFSINAPSGWSCASPN